MNQSKTTGYIAITIVAIIYGVSYMARNLITETGAMAPAIITLLQLSIMAALFGLYNLLTKKSIKIAAKHFPMVALAGFIGTFVFHTLSNISVAHVGAGIPSLLFGLAAAFALITSVVVYKKRANALSWVAVLTGLAGLYVIMGITPESFADTNFLGYGYSIGSVVAWVAYCFLADRVAGDYDKSVILFWNAVVGVAVSVPFLFFYPMDMVLISENLNNIVIALVILGLFNATIAYFMTLYAITKIGVNMSNIFLNFMPIATLGAMFVVYGQIPKSNEVIGGIIIISSVFLLGYAESLATKKEAAQKKTTTV